MTTRLKIREREWRVLHCRDNSLRWWSPWGREDSFRYPRDTMGVDELVVDDNDCSLLLLLRHHLDWVSLSKDFDRIIWPVDPNANPRRRQVSTCPFSPSWRSTVDDWDRVCIGWREDLFLKRRETFVDASKSSRVVRVGCDVHCSKSFRRRVAGDGTFAATWERDGPCQLLKTVMFEFWPCRFRSIDIGEFCWSRQPEAKGNRPTVNQKNK